MSRSELVTQLRTAIKEIDRGANRIDPEDRGGFTELAAALREVATFTEQLAAPKASEQS